MMPIITRLISMVPTIAPLTYLKWAIIAFVVVFAYGLGNNHATKRILSEQLVQERQASADRQRENHKQLLAWQKDMEQKLRAEAEQQRNADRIAYNALQDAKAESDAGRLEAERRLRLAFAGTTKLEETNNALRNVNSMLAEESRKNPPDPGCTMPPGVRQAIDGYIDSINTNPFVGASEAEATGIPPGTIATHPQITCRELTASVVDILSHSAYLLGLLGSWRAWADEALK